MGYNVEISIDVTNISELIESLAREHNCSQYYYMYEMDKHKKNHCIIAVTFEENEIFNCAKFIKYLKTRYKGIIYLDCIYEDNIGCKLIYASPCYLKQVEKDKVQKYRKRSLSENETMLLEAGGVKVNANSG